MYNTYSEKQIKKKRTFAQLIKIFIPSSIAAADYEWWVRLFISIDTPITTSSIHFKGATSVQV